MTNERNLRSMLSSYLLAFAFSVGFVPICLADDAEVSQKSPPALDPDVVATEKSAEAVMPSEAENAEQSEPLGSFPRVGATEGKPGNKPAALENGESSTESDQKSEEGAKKDDPEERLAELLSLVTDNTTKINKREMPAYWTLVDKAKQGDLQQLKKESRVNPRFNEFYSNPAKRRGELVTITLNVRRVIPYPSQRNKAGVKQLYELWGWTEEAKPGCTASSPPSFLRIFPRKEMSRNLPKSLGISSKCKPIILAMQPPMRKPSLLLC